MSPEYNFLVKTNLPGITEARRFAVGLYDSMGVVEVTLFEAGETLSKGLSQDSLIAKGKLIRQLRDGLGFNQAQFADRVGISDALMSSIENGRKPSSRETLARIAEELGIVQDDPRCETIMMDARTRHGRRKQTIPTE